MPGLLTESEARHHAAGLLSLKTTLKQWFSTGLDWLFPPRCAGCGRVDVVWCPHCQCHLEAMPVTLHRRVVDDVPVLSTGLHAHQLRQAIHAFKFGNVSTLSVTLGRRLLAGLVQVGWPIDVVVPVPLHSSRLIMRGYNQAQLLAEVIAEAHTIHHHPSAIRRILNTRSQVGLTGIERKQNMQDAFTADSEAITGKVVLIVDDVCTTGATLTACAQAALRAGARAVYGLTVTTASPQPLLPDILSLQP